MDINSKVYLGLPQDPEELLSNGDFEELDGADDFADWTETDQAGSEMLDNGDFEDVVGDNFADWYEGENGDSTIEDEQVEVHGDVHAVKITIVGTDSAEIIQEIAATPGKAYRATVWTKGDYVIVLGGPFGTSQTREEGTAADWEQIELLWTYDEEVPAVGLSLSAELADGKIAYFDDASVREEYTAVLDEDTIIHGDSHAVKLIGAGTAQASIYQTAACTDEKRIALSFWSKGDGENGLTYTIYDVTNAAEIYSGSAPVTTEWSKTTKQFYSPVDCVSIKITFETDGQGPYYLDDVTLLEYDEVVFEECEDVLAVPNPTWEYGISGSGPMNLVAATGTASFTLDNADRYYSPEGGERVVGFEEGMPVKITLSIDAEIADTEELLLNGSFEDVT